MAESAYTKGPWSIGPAHVVKRVFHLPDGRRCTQFLAECFSSTDAGDGHAPDGEANARLIAAAPDLVEALQAVVEDVSKYDGRVPDFTMRIARAALSRALGQEG